MHANAYGVKSKPWSASAFTLVEVLVAAGVAAVGFMAVLFLNMSNLRTVRSARQSNAATLCLQERAEQLRLAEEIGLMVKDLYDNLARIRDVRKQAADLATKTPALAAAAKTLKDRLDAVEADMTQMQGEGGQDALNFPGRMDNQLLALYGAIVGPERRMGSPILERYKDLKPQAEAVRKRWMSALQADLGAFNAAATRAGAAPIVVK